jgi:hypothetical protein
MLYDTFTTALTLGSLEQAERDRAVDLAKTGINLSPGPTSRGSLLFDQ